MTAYAGEVVKGNTHPLLVGMQTCASILEISVVVSQETGGQPLSGPSNSTLVNIIIL